MDRLGMSVRRMDWHQRGLIAVLMTTLLSTTASSDGQVQATWSREYVFVAVRRSDSGDCSAVVCRDPQPAGRSVVCNERSRQDSTTCEGHWG